MALLTLDFHSHQLKMHTVLTVIVPDTRDIGGKPMAERKVLTLLHGLSEDGTAGVRMSKVELYAQETGVVVVMPSVGRSMYCDNVNGQNYFSHVADEVPSYLHMLLGLSRKREDNYLAGISMGGMGASRIALTYPERYRMVTLLSGLLDFTPLMPLLTNELRGEFPFLLEMEGNLDGSMLNPINMLDAEKHKALEILIRCGEQDDMLVMSRRFLQRAQALGLNAKGIFEPGAHVWRLWDGCLDDLIKRIAEDAKQ